MKKLLILYCILTLLGCKPTIPQTAKPITVYTISQLGIRDTFKVNVCYVRLEHGDIFCQNDTQKFYGKYTVLASGIYKIYIK